MLLHKSPSKRTRRLHWLPSASLCNVARMATVHPQTFLPVISRWHQVTFPNIRFIGQWPYFFWGTRNQTLIRVAPTFLTAVS